jgi:hypothetical protein
VTIAAKPFADWAAIDATADTETAARSLLDAAWADFVSVRDFSPLHRLLTRLEREKGVTATHKAIGAKLKEKGAILAHCGFQKTELVGVAISNDGRYLATGAWVGDDYNAGGSMQVWDVASGHVVNALHVDGGVAGQTSRTRCSGRLTDERSGWRTTPMQWARSTRSARGVGRGRARG